MQSAEGYAKDIYNTIKESQTITKVGIKSKLLKNSDIEIGTDVFQRSFYTIGKGTLNKFPKGFPKNPTILRTAKEIMSTF